MIICAYPCLGKSTLANDLQLQEEIGIRFIDHESTPYSQSGNENWAEEYVLEAIKLDDKNTVVFCSTHTDVINQFISYKDILKDDLKFKIILPFERDKILERANHRVEEEIKINSLDLEKHKRALKRIEEKFSEDIGKNSRMFSEYIYWIDDLSWFKDICVKLVNEDKEKIKTIDELLELIKYKDISLGQVYALRDSYKIAYREIYEEGMNIFYKTNWKNPFVDKFEADEKSKNEFVDFAKRKLLEVMYLCEKILGLNFETLDKTIEFEFYEENGHTGFSIDLPDWFNELVRYGELFSFKVLNYRKNNFENDNVENWVKLCRDFSYKK